MKKLAALFLTAVLLIAATGCRSDTEQETTAEAADSAAAAQVKTVLTGDTQMDYTVFGSGKKSFVILPGLSVHSVMGSSEAIAEAYRDFTEEYTVYVFDRARNISEGYTVREMARDTAEAMKKLGIQNVDVFGASQGGMIAMYLAADYPEEVNKLILGSTLAKPNDTFNRVVDEWIRLVEEKNETGLLESFADNVYSKATLDTYRETLISSNRGITDEEYRRFEILAGACKTFDCYDELSEIKCPVYVIGSEGDRVVTAEGSRQIAQALGCKLYLYDESYGHGVYDEAADYRQRCMEFLSEESSTDR